MDRDEYFEDLHKNHGIDSWGRVSKDTWGHKTYKKTRWKCFCGCHNLYDVKKRNKKRKRKILVKNNSLWSGNKWSFLARKYAAKAKKDNGKNRPYWMGGRR